MNCHNIFTIVKPYSLNNQNIQKLISSEYFEENINDKNKTKQANPIIKSNPDFFIPTEEDNIFWCWILFKFGFSDYEILKETPFIIEKNYKINFVDTIRNNKRLLKHLKTKIQEMEGHLANDKILDIKYLEPMLILEKYNFAFMNDKIYYENIMYPGKPTCIIKYFKKLDKYGLFLEEKKLFEYKNKLFQVDNLLKPVKSISNYSAQEIRDICKKLNIDIMKTPTKTKTKKILYQLVIEHII